MTAATATRSLRDLLIDGLDVAIDAARPETEGCRDCPRYATGMCPPHQGDREFADDLERVQERIRAASDEEFDVLLGGTEGGTGHGQERD
jgi:hypothetical protein